MLSFSGQWIPPIVSGDCPPPCDRSSLTPLTDDTFVMFGGYTPDRETSATYIGHCTKSTIVSTILYKLTTLIAFGVSNWLLFLEMAEGQSITRSSLA